MGDVESKKGYVAIIDANPLKRLGAFFIDFNIFGIISVFILYFLAISGLISGEAVTRIITLRTSIYEPLTLFNSLEDIVIHIGVSAYFLAYFTVLESRHFGGRTIGKWILKIRVVDDRGKELSLKDSFLRNSTKYFLRMPGVGIPFGVLEIVLIFAFSKRTGDLLAGTSVASGTHEGTFTG